MIGPHPYIQPADRDGYLFAFRKGFCVVLICLLGQAGDAAGQQVQVRSVLMTSPIKQRQSQANPRHDVADELISFVSDEAAPSPGVVRVSSLYHVALFSFLPFVALSLRLCQLQLRPSIPVTSFIDHDPSFSSPQRPTRCTRTYCLCSKNKYRFEFSWHKFNLIYKKYVQYLCL